MTGKYNCYAHKDCNINLRLKKLMAKFHNLRSYDSHLIMQETVKFNVNINVIPNRLEKHMALTINRSFVFIDSIQFTNCILDVLIKNFSDNGFKYLPQECSDNLFDS